MTRAYAVATVLFTAALALSGLSGVTSADPRPDGFAVGVESNTKPEFVSGGDVLVRVDRGNHVRVWLGGRDVTSSFTPQPNGTLLGVVRGLRDGTNVITATADRGRHASVRVVNHPRSGPVFSGRQQVPFYCQTEAHGLAPASQPLCEAPTVVRYAYKSTSGQFVPLADPATRPADLATATVEGVTVPYVVRVEVGVIDRAVYQMAALYDGADPSPVKPETGWNGRLVYNFGGGCNGGYRQGGSTAPVLEDLFLSQGYAVASSSLNVLDNNCGTVISAEAAMMVKEHFLETYGPARHTIGWGGSGGAIQQYDIADAYPGILDGIVPGISFPDPLTTMSPVTDCGLLNAYFARGGFTPEQQRAVSGYNTYDTCTSWGLTFFNRATATGSCDPIIPVETRWSPTNPSGVRCSAAEQWVNQLGRDPRTGFVRAVLDNVGVQYGLAALRSGQITPAQFAAMNAGVGGLDYAGRPIPTRTTADPRGLAAAYSSDLINSASEGLRYTPIIDQRTYLDLVPVGDIHTAEMSFIMRARLRAANGTAANQVIIASSVDPAPAAAAAAYQLDAMDRWLSAIDDDASHRDPAAKVIANKPRDLADGCYVSPTERVTEPMIYPSSGRCGALFPAAANPRLVAGANLPMTTIKCRLKPLNFHDYGVTFTAEEKAQLRQAFPTGVCDYTRRGVSEQPARGPWQTF
ncbi:DUF6351 family protein [Actinophytocola oryzae]|uniref:DUF6351 domain-containing protein n=1 Tax=Actinophytocola oryzae TaxID=502181 RepID=A0A4R7VYN1_9PSEU|nr:DUF6351 family protein [Actinophytocola oryzae]TDV55184.1 hypothetical protein CLV71_103425 [Actinophytocola oryzae]